ncbi:hypothetical protein [Nonomuraea sediminis]|uniref:hypothetical protein n=1 Tax=Nonomuraea sediminis TaxID=2835864 RepID=UPI001BDD0EAE|nr:hypothetical protein [Nonomuraea sediminis]
MAAGLLRRMAEAGEAPATIEPAAPSALTRLAVDPFVRHAAPEPTRFAHQPRT